jgi:hypothetical protein
LTVAAVAPVVAASIASTAAVATRSARHLCAPLRTADLVMFLPF